MVPNPCCCFMAESRPYGSGLSYISTGHRRGLHIHSLSSSFQLFSSCSVNIPQKQAGVQKLSISQETFVSVAALFSVCERAEPLYLRLEVINRSKDGLSLNLDLSSASVGNNKNLFSRDMEKHHGDIIETKPSCVP